MLDQAIAHGSSERDVSITAETMRDMLGLSDRARIVDLFEFIMKGDIASALGELKSQYDTGAEPELVLTDLADFIHLVTRLKYVPDSANDGSLTEIEKTRGKEFSDKLSVRILGRAWQLLLKGLGEVSTSERPLAAAEMVLVRMAHASSLPTPDELLKEMQQGSSETRTAPLATPPASVGDATASTSMPSSTPPSTQPTMSSEQSGSNVLAMKQPEPAPVTQIHETPNETAASFKTLNTFDELIFLVEDKRDLALKTMIKRHVRIVAFADGRMDMNLVENAPRDFLGSLGKRLEEWTGKRWVLSISKEQGHPTLAEQEASENEARMDDAKSDPAVEAIMSQFPGARIIDIRVREEEALLDAPEEKDEDELGEFLE